MAISPARRLNVSVPASTEKRVKGRASFEQAFKTGNPAPEVSIKKLTLNLPADAHARLKAHAASHGVSMTDLLLEFIDQLD